jgi:amino acid permease
MDPDFKAKLDETFRLAEENNKILRQMRRSMRWSSVLHVFYWILIIGSAFGAYYFLQPYINQAEKVLGNTQNSINNFNSVFSGLKK